jgi:hypothetical protein
MADQPLGRLSAHSLRSGFVTEAGEQGISLGKTMATGCGGIDRSLCGLDQYGRRRAALHVSCGSSTARFLSCQSLGRLTIVE